jgi:hypothetical protein
MPIAQILYEVIYGKMVADIATLYQKKRCHGIERDPLYVDQTIRKDYGKSAVREGTEECFSMKAEQRNKNAQYPSTYS